MRIVFAGTPEFAADQAAKAPPDDVRWLLEPRSIMIVPLNARGRTLGAIFIGLVQNGMNLARIESYLQIVVIGVLLIIAVVADQLRQRMMAKLRD